MRMSLYNNGCSHLQFVLYTYPVLPKLQHCMLLGLKDTFRKTFRRSRYLSLRLSHRPSLQEMEMY